MVVAQLVEWSLPIPEVRGSNPVISKIYIENTKINKKRPGMTHFKKSTVGVYSTDPSTTQFSYYSNPNEKQTFTKVEMIGLLLGVSTNICLT